VKAGRRNIPTDAPPPHRSKKDRRRWCRGKVGTEHVQVVRYQHQMVDWQRRQVDMGRVERPLCGWSPMWRVENRADGRWSVPVRWSWGCSHEIGCSVCGKRLEYLHGPDCPDYRPLTDVERLGAQPHKW
jgi:hypothetical protein